MKIIDVKVTLIEAEPEVSRTLKVPTLITLELFHNTIQYAMGWQFSHLYKFELGQQVWSGTFGHELIGKDARYHRLSEIIKSKSADKLVYTYDLGDCWMHSFEFGKQSVPNSRRYFPILTGGTGECPIEDSGGISEHNEIMEQFLKPENKRQEGFTEWLEEVGPLEYDFKTLEGDVAKFAQIINRLGHV